MQGQPALRMIALMKTKRTTPQMKKKPGCTEYPQKKKKKNRKKNQSKQTNRANRKVEQNGTIATDQTDAQKVLTEIRELLQPLVNQINSQASNDSGKITQQEGAAPTGRRRFQCYGCKQTGHILRDCPDRSGKLGNVQINKATQPQGQRGQGHLN